MASKRYAKAAEAVKRRNYDYAIELFLQELTLDPDNAEARRALRAAELKKFQEAGKDPSPGLAVLSGFGPWLGARLAAMSKNWEKCMLACEQFLKKAPSNAGMLMLLGRAAKEAGHMQAAVTAFEEVREIDGRNTAALRGLGQLYRDLGDDARALRYYEELRKVAPSDPEASRAVRDLAAAGATKRAEERSAKGSGGFRDQLKSSEAAKSAEHSGRVIRSAADADAAIERLEKQLNGTSDDARVHKLIGDAQIKKKDFDSALESFEKSLEARDDPIVQDAIGDLKFKMLDEEASILKRAAAKGDSAAKGKYAAIRKKRLELAVEEYTRRVKLRPTETSLRFQLGSCLLKAKRYDDALGELQKAVKDPRRGSQARLLLGRCFAAKGMVDLAAKEFERARKAARGMDDLGKEATYSLALLFEKSGKKDKAAEELEKIIEVDISYKDVMKRMEALQSS
jgi:tetratricopeptide (TPR) repeat protein